LVKTRRFKDPTYVGDPINAIRIFNEKEVDELMLLDVGASNEGRGPDFKLLTQVASECFMPLAYGGGLRTVEEMEQLLALGIEKVVVNRQAVFDPGLVDQAAARLGSQSVVVSIDVKRTLFGAPRVYAASGTKDTGRDPATFAREMRERGAGEILLTSIDRDGTMKGYDLDLLRQVTAAVDVPVVASGGAGALGDLRRAVHEAGASAVSAGSLFVFHGSHRAVLITFPSRTEIEATFALEGALATSGSGEA
jgi:cyclase